MPSPNEYQQQGLEQDALSRVSAGSTALSKGTVTFVALGGIAVAGWILYSGITRQPVKNDDGEFNTTPFTPPVVTAENFAAPKPVPDIIKIEPTPKPPPAPPPASPPAPIVAVGPDSPTLPPQPPQTITTPPEQVIALPPQPPLIMVAPALPLPAPEAPLTVEPPKVVEVKPQEDDKWVRLRADSIVSDTSKDKEDEKELSAEEAAVAAAEETDKNLAFLEKVGNAPVKMETAKKIERIDAMVPQGTLIKGILETAIQSDLAGMVRAVTSEDVYSFDGRRVLIPSGTRLLGDYKSGIENGQTRVFIVWTRMLRPDGVSVQLGSTGADELGRGGMPGDVDNHYAQRYGSAVLLSLIGGGAKFLQSWGFGADQAVKTVSRTLADGSVETITSNASELEAQARQAAADQISENLTKLATDALEKNIDIAPTIHVDQGERITVFVRRDLDFSAFYEDPVIEALREIKRERAVTADSLPQ
jgi:type IV secretion system protein VirB10